MIYELAITINQQGTRDGWLGEVAEWLQESGRIIQLIAGEEIGDTGTRHLQIVAKTNVGAQQMRNDITTRFMELRGEKSKKGQKMSIAVTRKSWERNVAYCLKDGGVTYTKGVTQDEVDTWRDEGLSQAKADKKDTPSWNEQLRAACTKAHANTAEDIGKVIVRAYLGIKKTIPDRFQLARLITTVELMMREGHWTQENLITQIVKEAIEIKERVL